MCSKGLLGGKEQDSLSKGIFRFKIFGFIFRIVVAYERVAS